MSESCGRMKAFEADEPLSAGSGGQRAPASVPVREASQNPWAVAARKLRRDGAAMVSLILCSCVVRARCLRRRRFTRLRLGTDPFATNLNGETRHQTGKPGRGVWKRRPRAPGPRHDADSARSVGIGPLRLGRRQPVGVTWRPRLLYGGPAILAADPPAWRPPITLGRERRFWASSPDLSGAGRRRAVAPARNLVAFPIYLLAISAVDRAHQQRLRHRPNLDHLRQLGAAHRHHRHCLRALCRPADPPAMCCP